MIKGKSVILVVDDEPLNLAIIREFLQDNGYEVVCADSATEAQALLENNSTAYDAVLVDRMMPGMDGMALLAWIKRHPELRNLPVIIQSARGSKEDIQEGLDAGSCYYLVKPFDEEQLVFAVRSTIHSCLTGHHHKQLLGV